MIATILILFLVAGITSGNMGQNTMYLTFTAVDSAAYVQLDSIKVMNRTRGGDTVLYWPDTVLSIYYVGIHENPSNESAFQVFQNFPNPVAYQTTVSLYVPEKDKVSIIVTDILGRMIVESESVMDKGKHSFLFTPGNSSLYNFDARWKGQSSSIKIIQTESKSQGKSSLEYSGSEDYSPQIKSMQSIQSFFFAPGDELLYIGCANTLQSGLVEFPEVSATYNFQFATNIPCPGTPTVEYQGKVYNTIQIFSQCWLKENLNVGTMIPGGQTQSNNGTIEKYCYNNEPDSCAKYGGLYQWDEMMQYTTQNGTRGICPPGWRLPTEEEWKVLEAAADSQYGMGDPVWDIYGYRGFDAGTNLKTTSGWYIGDNGNDLFGFSGLPGGYGSNNGSFYNVGDWGAWGSSTQSEEFISHPYSRTLCCNFPEVCMWYLNREHGHSVRCLMDY